MAKVKTVLPGCRVFRALVTTPACISATRPGVSSSVWMPRSTWSCRAAQTASGKAPMPICKVEPFSIRPAMRLPMTRSCGCCGALPASSRGAACSTRAVTWDTCTVQSPNTRGICGLTSRITRRAVLDAARA
ncbi:hypothetical protein D3C85_1285540 [compost metagenome]